MKVKYKKLNKLAKEPFKKYPEDFCYDLYATSREEIMPGVFKYGLGLAFEIERDKEPIFVHEIDSEEGTKVVVTDYVYDMRSCPANLSLDFRPRSSIYETGLILSNCVGSIDELYRGECSAIFYHLMKELPPYEVGDRIVQCKIGLTLPIKWEEVKELNETKRGTGGYGSTGRK